jgi:gluconolactonase
MRTSILAFLLASFLHAAQPAPTNHGAVGAGEGPVADKNGNLYFTAADRISKRDPSGKVTIYREPSGGANGLIFDLQGRLIVCESNNRRITRMEPNGQITILTDQYESKKYNSPNDVSID